MIDLFRMRFKNQVKCLSKLSDLQDGIEKSGKDLLIFILAGMACMLNLVLTSQKNNVGDK